MKKLTVLFALLLAFTMAFSGCSWTRDSGNNGGNGDITQGGDGNDDNQGGSGEDGENPPDEEEGEEWDGPAEELTITVGNSAKPTYGFSSDGTLMTVTQTKQATVNTLASTDDFGRSFGYTDGFEDKYICLFYFLWLGQHTWGDMDGIYDISKLLQTDPAALWDTNGNAKSPLRQAHFWGEPLYGYYNSLDYWVLRKHVELFIAAGIDCLVFDVTNTVCYFPVVERLANILRAYQNQGWKVPKFMFYTHTDSGATVRKLYQGTGDPNANPFERDGLYKLNAAGRGNFDDLWFMPNGKPQIIAEMPKCATISTCGKRSGRIRSRRIT